MNLVVYFFGMCSEVQEENRERNRITKFHLEMTIKTEVVAPVSLLLSITLLICNDTGSCPQIATIRRQS